MRYGILSDVHSNLPALQTVIDALDEAQIDATICLGDVVGYGPNPNECVELLRERDAVIVMGNHDEAAAKPGGDENFNPLAQAAIEWTRAALSADNAAYLAGLPDTKQFDDFAIVHGAPGDRFAYILDAAGARHAFQDAKKPLTFVGHSHVAEVYYQDEDGRTFHDRLMHGGLITVDSGYRYIVNPGSVGQPRDRNPQASFALYDNGERTIDVRRVTYDIGTVQRRIEAVNLPWQLGARLATGR